MWIKPFVKLLFIYLSHLTNAFLLPTVETLLKPLVSIFMPKTSEIYQSTPVKTIEELRLAPDKLLKPSIRPETVKTLSKPIPALKQVISEI